MKQIKVALARLKKPSVIISLVSEIVAVLVLLKINVDRNYIMAVVTAICGVLTTLGILSNPATEKKGFGEEIHYCESCKKDSVFVKVNGKMVCKDCGIELGADKK